jgi:hypothetical protein
MTLGSLRLSEHFVGGCVSWPHKVIRNNSANQASPQDFISSASQLRRSFRIHATGTAGRAFCCGVILIAEEFCITPRWRLTSKKIEQAPASVTLCFACASVIHSCFAPLFSLCPNNILPFSLTG